MSMYNELAGKVKALYGIRENMLAGGKGWREKCEEKC